MAFELTEAQRAKVRHFMGYPNLTNRYTLTSGVPFSTPTALLLEENMRNILDQAALDIITSVIDKIEDTRCRITQAQSRLIASEVAYTVKMNKTEIQQLWLEDYRLCLQLGILLSVPIYKHPTGRSELSGSGGAGNIPIIDCT